MFYGLVLLSTVIAYLLYVTCMREVQTESSNSLFKEWITFTPKRLKLLLVYLLASVVLIRLFYLFGYGPTKIMKYCMIMGGLVPTAYEDYREKRIPNRFLLYLIGLRAVLFITECCLYPAAIRENVIFTFGGGIIILLVMLIAYFISRQQIGLGDVKLFAVIGLYLGMSVTYFVILASLLVAALYGVVNLLRKKLGAKDEIAFGPFILIGTIIILAMGF